MQIKKQKNKPEAKACRTFPTNYQDTLKIDGATILIDATLHIPDTTTVTSNKARAQPYFEEGENVLQMQEKSCYPVEW